jgi:hypothetical protein
VHDAGVLTMHDDGNNTSVAIGPVADGTTVLGVTGSLDVSGSVAAGTMTVAAGSLTDSSGAISFGDETITALGNVAFGADDDSSALSIHSAGTITIYDDSDDTNVVIGPVADGTTTLGITGSLDVSGSVDAGTMTVAAGSITDSSGAISFGNETLSTSGTVAAGATTVTGDLTVLHAAGNGGMVYKRYYDDVNIAAAASATCDLNIPAGAEVLGVQLHVKAALAATETWDAELNDGAQEEVITTNLAVAQNTNYNHFSALVTDAETDILIQKNSSPGVDSFTAQGTIECTAYTREFVAWSNE